MKAQRKQEILDELAYTDTVLSRLGRGWGYEDEQGSALRSDLDTLALQVRNLASTVEQLVEEVVPEDDNV